MFTVDFAGNTFANVIDMCNYYGIPKTTFYHRLNRGWDEKRALTTPSPVAIDHHGKRYKSVKDMCDAYSVSVSTFISRMKRGWSIERSLTEPAQQQAKIITPSFTKTAEKSSVQSANDFVKIMEFYEKNKDMVNDIISLYEISKQMNA